jgi:hypothetical protein
MVVFLERIFPGMIMFERVGMKDNISVHKMCVIKQGYAAVITNEKDEQQHLEKT